jgi:hypothetical protein
MLPKGPLILVGNDLNFDYPTPSNTLDPNKGHDCSTQHARGRMITII